MLLRPLILLVFLVAPAALAQADLSVSFFGTPGQLRTGESHAFLVQVANLGPADAQNVVVEIDIPGELGNRDPLCTPTKPVRCTIGGFTSPGQTLSFFAWSTLPNTAGPVTARATVTSATSDPNPVNNTATATIDLVAKPDLWTEMVLWNSRLDPSGRGKVNTGIINWSGTPAENARVTYTMPDGGTIVGYEGNYGRTDCTIDGGTMVCELGTMAKDEGRGIIVEFQAPDRTTGGSFRVAMDASSSNEDYQPEDNHRETTILLSRPVLVTNTNDSGPGSLRQALIDTAGCTDFCKVFFRIEGPVPEGGRFTIRPLTPLPLLHGIVTVDATSQTAFTGDTNPDGPEVVIDGSLAGESHGFFVGAGCEVVLKGMEIRGFDGHGVEVRNERQLEQLCFDMRIFAGVSIESNHIHSNRRGIVAGGGPQMTVRGNVISRNQRAGIFLHSGGAGIFGNRIEHNGATGIFVDRGGADIERNTIAHNDEWGIARSAGPFETSIRENSIFDNRYLGIDIGLDFETPAVESDALFPNPPELLSATYDPATNTTTIRGRFKSNHPYPTGNWQLEFFATRERNRSGRVEGERPLGSMYHQPGEFTFTVKEDLTGQFITATHTRYRVEGFAKPLSHLSHVPSNTSEFSNAVEVK